MTLRRRRLLIILAVSLAVLPGGSSAQVAGGYGDYINWEGWAQVDSLSRPGLASSWDRAGGRPDYNHYEFPQGLIDVDTAAVAATIRGPGIIYRFWMPHLTANQYFPVRVTFDAESAPRIDTDSRHLLTGPYAYFHAPFVDTFAGGQVCYEPIPFRDSLRIETENRAELLHFYQYSYRTFAPGTDLESWDGTLDAEAQAARLATAALFENAGQHPAGEDPSAVRTVVGPAPVPAFGRLVLAQLDGPGRIRRVNVRMDAATDAQLEAIRLRVYWDADSLPSIDAPVGWFFGAGDGRVGYRSLPMGTDSPGGFYCYWPMPFRRGARLELYNPTAGAVPIDSTVVEHEPEPVGGAMGYLHAAARDTIQAPGMTWFKMAEARGSGHYVGNLLFVEQDAASQYLLEGDDVVIVDEADTLHGTGLEDAYNGGYYYNWFGGMPEPEGVCPASAIRPLSGILRVELASSPPFARADQYRWMIADRVPFRRSLEVMIESCYSEPGARWSSVVFWYELHAGAAGGISGVEPGGGPRVEPGAGPGAEPGNEAGADGARSQAATPRLLAAGAVNADLVVRFALPAGVFVELDLLDVSGRKLAILHKGGMSGGVHEVRWSRGGLPGGVYFVRLRAGGVMRGRKVVLVQ